MVCSIMGVDEHGNDLVDGEGERILMRMKELAGKLEASDSSHVSLFIPLVVFS